MFPSSQIESLNLVFAPFKRDTTNFITMKDEKYNLFNTGEVWSANYVLKK